MVSALRARRKRCARIKRLLAGTLSDRNRLPLASGPRVLRRRTTRGRRAWRRRWCPPSSSGTRSISRRRRSLESSRSTPKRRLRRLSRPQSIVVHGSGVHPDWGLNNGLRTGLAEAGIATLSVQMPVLGADAPSEQYAKLCFPSPATVSQPLSPFFATGAFGAHRHRLAQHGRIHGRCVPCVRAGGSNRRMGADRHDARIRVRGPRCRCWISSAERDLPQVLEERPKRTAALPRDGCSKHVSIAGADHLMEQQQRELIAADRAISDASIRWPVLSAKTPRRNSAADALPCAGDRSRRATRRRRAATRSRFRRRSARRGCASWHRDRERTRAAFRRGDPGAVEIGGVSRPCAQAPRCLTRSTAVESAQDELSGARRRAGVRGA